MVGRRLTGNGALHTLPASTRRGNRHRIGIWHDAAADKGVVDRVVVLDHGEKIFDGAPDAAQSDARGGEVYLGPTWSRERAGNAPAGFCA